MKKRPFFSIVMPSYNSAGTIKTALHSIRSQNIDQSDIEIFVVDGGSTDETLEIAEKYGANILHNDKRLPEYAKLLGMQQISGKYYIRMDSDEELADKGQLGRRMEFLLQNPEIKATVVNELLVPLNGKYGISLEYMNRYGDPFTYFVYQRKRTILKSYAKNINKGEGRCCVLKFSKDDLPPIGDAASTTISLDFIWENYKDKMNTIEFSNAVTYIVIEDTGLCGCLEDDKIYHHSQVKIRNYLKKLRFRVINNLFFRDEGGFSSREQRNPSISKWKKLFIIYAISIVWPLWDSIKLSVIHKDIKMMLHFFYLYYVCIYAAWCIVKNMFIKQKRSEDYGK